MLIYRVFNKKNSTILVFHPRGFYRSFHDDLPATSGSGSLKKKIVEVKKDKKSHAAYFATPAVTINKVGSAVAGKVLGQAGVAGKAPFINRNYADTAGRGIYKSASYRGGVQRGSKHKTTSIFVKKNFGLEQDSISDSSEVDFVSSRIKRLNLNELTVGLNLGQRGIPRRKRFYFQRKSLKEWRDFSNILPNFSNKPFYLKSNWDNRKVWKSVFFFRFANREHFFKNKRTLRIYFMRYLLKRKNSQLKAFLSNYFNKKRRVFSYFRDHLSNLVNFVLTWGYIRNMTLSRTKFIVQSGFIYVNFNCVKSVNYFIKVGDCVTATYFSRNMLQPTAFVATLGSTKWHKSMREFRHFHKFRRRKFLNHNNFRQIFFKLRFSRLSHWSKKYFVYFFRFFESSPIVKAFVFFFFFSWFAYRFSKYLNYFLFGDRAVSIFLNTRLF